MTPPKGVWKFLFPITVFAGSAFANPAVQKLTNEWNTFLKKHVDERGAVSYQGFATDEQKLSTWLALHKNLNVTQWTDDTKKAVYINLYNGFMIYNILRYVREKKIALTSKEFLALEVDDIRVKGGNIWNGDYKTNLAGQTVHLDNIEHDLIRGKAKSELAKLKVKVLDPRIHMAVNCAAMSCPRVREKAYTPDNVEQMLAENFQEFMNAGKQIKYLDNKKLHINKIILWYYEDFDEHAQKILKFDGAGDYLATVINPKITHAEMTVTHLKKNLNDRSKFALRFSRAVDFFYDWKINDTRNFP